MAPLFLILLVPWLATLEAKADLPAARLESEPFSSTTTVFETGNFHTKTMEVGTSSPCSPPKSLLIVRPLESGTFPVILFHHGTALRNSWYTDLLEHVSSHGYIVVAPQLYKLIPPSGQDELDMAAKVANWLPSGLQCVVPENIKGDMGNLAVAGHSRGGYIAFALALGLSNVRLEVDILGVVGVCPVAGPSKYEQLEPKLLNQTPCSFNLSIPVSVIGTGLGDKPVFPLMPACSPKGVNHEDFFYECKPPCGSFVAKDYGHMDLLNDNLNPIGSLARSLCKGSGRGVSRVPMRRTVGGIIVSYLKAYFAGDDTDYKKILQEPNPLTPATLDPVRYKKSCSDLASMATSSLGFEYE